jgi:hypothetical protein
VSQPKKSKDLVPGLGCVECEIHAKGFMECNRQAVLKEIPITGHESPLCRTERKGTIDEILSGILENRGYFGRFMFDKDVCDVH